MNPGDDSDDPTGHGDSGDGASGYEDSGDRASGYEVAGAAEEPVVDWRSRVGTAGLIIGSAMVGLDRVLFPEKRKADTEQVTSEPLDRWPRLDFGGTELDQLGPDDEGYWPG